jgi:hypothetical protein
MVERSVREDGTKVEGYRMKTIFSHHELRRFESGRAMAGTGKRGKIAIAGSPP